MAEILSQTEIDSLIATLLKEESGAQPEETAGRSPDPRAPRRVRAYDFKRPDKFSKEQLRTLQVIHENFARLLTTYYTATFRTMVQLVVGSVDQSTYSEFIRSVQNPSVICPFTLSPLQGTCVLDVNPLVAFPMLDRMFGGPGSALTQVRELTDIEKIVMQRVVQGTLSALREAWASVDEVNPEISGIEANPIFVQVAAPNEIVATIAIDVRVGEHVGVITLCIPHLTLEPILTKLSAHNRFAGSARQVRAGDRPALEESMGQALVPVTARLGQAELNIRELLQLAPGDLILLERRTDDHLEIFVGNQRRFSGRPGQSRGRLAVEITGLLESGGAEDVK